MSAEYLILREDIHAPLRSPKMSDGDYLNMIHGWRRGLSSEQLMKHDLLRLQTFGMLGIPLDFTGRKAEEAISQIIHDPVKTAATTSGVYQRLGRSLGLEDPASKFKEYAVAANAAVDEVATLLSYPGSANIEMVNEVRSEYNPTALLLMALNGEWHPKARFVARRKLLFMNLAASIDQRKRTIHIDDQLQNFQTWLNTEFWNPDTLLGETTGAYIISDHDPKTWKSSKARIIPEEMGINLELSPFQKKTHILQRSFIPEGSLPINAFASVREKPLSKAITKMIRKGEEDPAITVDDDTGFMIVVKDKKDARTFIKHLMVRGFATDYPIRIEDVSYTLDGEKYNGKGASSPKIRMLKFFVRLANEMRVEVIVYTPETYVEHLYARGICHPEYETNRLFDDRVNVPNLEFPPKYFPHFDAGKGREERIKQIRYDIERESLVA